MTGIKCHDAGAHIGLMRHKCVPGGWGHSFLEEVISRGSLSRAGQVEVGEEGRTFQAMETTCDVGEPHG